MPRCLRCNAPVLDGEEYCPPDQWFEYNRGFKAVRFDGCASMRAPIYRPRMGKRVHAKRPTPEGITEGRFSLLPKVYSMPHAGEIPLWILEGSPCYSNLRCYKYEAGSAFTNEHYGFGWSRFSQELRRVATELHIALVGFHVPTLAAAEVVEDVLLGERQPSKQLNAC